MQLRRSALRLGLIAAISSLVTSCASKYDTQPAFDFLFQAHPVNRACGDRWLGQRLPPGTTVAIFGPQAPYLRSRLDTLQLPLSDVPALTIAAEPINFVHVAGEARKDWNLQFCAQGEGNSDQEAHDYLQKISMTRTGSLVTLNETHPNGLTGGKADLIVDAPSNAPITAHTGAIDLHDMSGPVRVSAEGRATILNTSGRVDANAMIVDFAGSQGAVSLYATWEVNIKLTAQQFHGILDANAQRQVRVLAYPGFQTPIEIVVSRTRDFICRADFCSKIKKERLNGGYRFTYGDLHDTSADQLHLRSESSTVIIDTEQ